MPKTKPSDRAASSTFRLGADLLDAMARLHARDGISPSEMARRALTAFLIDRGVLKPPSRPKKRR
jgi:hypothetical protein